jgi:hypothetical protein
MSFIYNLFKTNENPYKKLITNTETQIKDFLKNIPPCYSGDENAIKNVLLQIIYYNFHFIDAIYIINNVGRVVCYSNERFIGCPEGSFNEYTYIKHRNINDEYWVKYTSTSIFDDGYIDTATELIKKYIFTEY